jgi:hypothetical protein
MALGNAFFRGFVGQVVYLRDKGLGEFEGERLADQSTSSG